MKSHDDRSLVFLFIGLGAILLGVLIWNLHSRSTLSETALRKAEKEFTEQFPQTLSQQINDLQFDRIKVNTGDVPDLVFYYPGNASSPVLTARLEQIVHQRFDIAGRLSRNGILLYGIHFRGKPLGRVVLQGTESASITEAVVGLIIDDFGYNRSGLVNDFFRLGNSITISIIPGHPYSTEIARMAAAQDVETMIHMPMESEEPLEGEEDFILLENMSSREIITRMNRAFEEIPNAAGLNNHQGSLATQDPNLMQTVLYLLQDRDMYFIDSYTTPFTVGWEMAEKLGIPTGKRTVFLDNEESPEYIREQLDELVTRAGALGSAIGIGHYRQVTYQVLQEYIPYYESQGVRFVRISELVQGSAPEEFAGNAQQDLTMSAE